MPHAASSQRARHRQNKLAVVKAVSSQHQGCIKAVLKVYDGCVKAVLTAVLRLYCIKAHMPASWVRTARDRDSFSIALILALILRLY